MADVQFSKNLINNLRNVNNGKSSSSSSEKADSSKEGRFDAKLKEKVNANSDNIDKPKNKEIDSLKSKVEEVSKSDDKLVDKVKKIINDYISQDETSEDDKLNIESVVSALLKVLSNLEESDKVDGGNSEDGNSKGKVDDNIVELLAALLVIVKEQKTSSSDKTTNNSEMMNLTINGNMDEGKNPLKALIADMLSNSSKNEDDLLEGFTKVLEEADINPLIQSQGNSSRTESKKDKLLDIIAQLTAKSDNASKSDQLLLNNKGTMNLFKTTSAVKAGEGEAEKSKDDLVLEQLVGGKENKGKEALGWLNSSRQISNANVDTVGGSTEQVISKATVASDILKTIDYMNSNSIKELTVKIKPKELGEVVIKLVMEGSVMKAEITAQNKESYNLINSRLSEINNNLQQYKVSEVNINVFSEPNGFDNKQSDGQANSHSNAKKNSSNIIGTDEIEEEVTFDDSQVNLLV